MKLREQILQEHSKAQTTKIVNWIGNDEKRYEQLFNIFLHDEPMVVQRAAWPLRYASTANPGFIYRRFHQLVDNLDKPGIHDAVTRNTVRIIEEMEIPEEFEGRLMDRCFNYVTDPKEKAAVKASSLSILYNLSKKYPDIRDELKTAIESQWNFEGPAFRARGRRILKNLK